MHFPADFQENADVLESYVFFWKSLIFRPAIAGSISAPNRQIFPPPTQKQPKTTKNTKNNQKTPAVLQLPPLTPDEPPFKGGRYVMLQHSCNTRDRMCCRKRHIFCCRKRDRFCCHRRFGKRPLWIEPPNCLGRFEPFAAVTSKIAAAFKGRLIGS